jgi:hypothetical protein
MEPKTLGRIETVSNSPLSYHCIVLAAVLSGEVPRRNRQTLRNALAASENLLALVRKSQH